MEFGGPWTQEKLRILGLYLDAYTMALKNQRFKLVYIDAFAASGLIRTQDREAMSFLKWFYRASRGGLRSTVRRIDLR